MAASVSKIGFDPVIEEIQHREIQVTKLEVVKSKAGQFARPGR